MSGKKVLVPVAPGFEEIEAVTIIDVLRRADVTVVVAGLEAGPIRGAHDLVIATDAEIAELEAPGFDAVVLPGGMPGATNLRDHPAVQRLLKAVHDQGGLAAAICAAPIALGPGGLAKERTITSYPGFGEQVDHGAYVEDRVVIDDRVVTSRGPGTALEFALTLVERLVGAETAAQLEKAMLVQRVEKARVI